MLTTKTKNIQFSHGEIIFLSQQLTLKTDIATSKSQLETGLMYRKMLKNDQGMLLIFSKNIMSEIWMKNMLIPLDIIFISSQNKVIYLLKSIPPCLKTPCPTYKPQSPFKMVLELNTGKIDEYKIKIGDKVSLLIY